jgi:WD repeat-containing protein 45
MFGSGDAGLESGTFDENTSYRRPTTSLYQPPTDEKLLTCSFNQDGGCLAIGTTSGFTIHNVYPHYAVSVRRQLSSANPNGGSAIGATSCGGIGRIEMLFRCNIMAIVGGGPAPYTPPYRVMLYDDHSERVVGELSFRQMVLRVKLRKDSIAVALRDRIYVYHLSDLSLRDKIYTADNPHGLLCLSTQIRNMVLACPSVTTGHVRVELYGLRKTVVRTGTVFALIQDHSYCLDCFTSLRVASGSP